MKRFEYDNIAPIQTTAGLVKGYCFDGIHTFKGIPYAYADRFQLPVEPKKYEGVFEATSYGRVCPLMMQDNPTGELMVPHMYWPTNEHCQSLNIWSKDVTAKKPVMVWIHGGGYFAGSSIEQLAYDGANMAQDGDVVVVSLNHRLNILGFLDLEPFGKKYKNSANAGLADIVAALKWIKANIAAFGGDPDNVTLFGQSGGGMKISALMQIPEAEGLFHKAIMMSGIAGTFMPPCSNGDGTMIVTAMLEKLNIPVEEVEKLETVPYEDLVKAYMASVPEVASQGGYVGNNPRIDDYFLGEAHMTHFTKQALNTPVMIGSVFGEFTGFAPKPYNKNEMSEEEMITIISQAFGDKTKEIVEKFKVAYPERKIIDVLSIDTLFRPLKKAFIQAKAEHEESPVYSYVFSLDFPVHHGQTAWHCSDIPFFFNNVDKVPSAHIEGVSERLQSQMFGAFMAFAHTGNPNHEGIPTWEASKPNDEVTMIFSDECRVAHNFDNQLLADLKEVLPELTLEMMMAQMSDIQH